MSTLALKGGTVLIHDSNDHVEAKVKDILVEGGVIKDIADSGTLNHVAGATVLHCKDKIISPGFVDTHHHLWQTLLKGRHANEPLLDYMYTGNYQSSNHTAEDIFWAQLGGCLEALDAGTTTVVDHAHMNYSPEHTRNAIAATVSSGTRCVFCYCPTPRIASWNPLTPNQNMLEDWVVDTFEQLATESPFGENGRVTLGFAFDGWYLPRDAVIPVFEKVKAAGTKVITTHYVRSPVLSLDSLPKKIDSWGLLDERMLISHSGNMLKDDAELYERCRVHASSTPDTELQMSMGQPVCFDNDLAGMQFRTGLGIDCHSNNNASIVASMRLVLQNARAMNDAKYIAEEKMPAKVYKTVEEAFNLGTIIGARAAKMSETVGSIAVGKRADFAIFDAISPALVCAAQHDPVAAIVLHSSPADIDTVVVDGRIIKSNGKLVPVPIDQRGQSVVGVKKDLEWKQVASELMKRRSQFQEKINHVDWADARQATIGMLHVQEDRIVDDC